MSNILLIDNYDSFTFNLAQLVAEVSGVAPDVIRNDQVSWSELAAQNYSRIIISPGPGTPSRQSDLGLSLDVLLNAQVPIFGVCLGHQAIGHVFGATIGLAREPVHGRRSRISHEGRDLFADLPSPFLAVRYHSLAVNHLSPELVALAWSEDRTLMALRHRSRPLWGVQFHPESICTEHGAALLKRFFELSEEYVAFGHAPVQRRHADTQRRNTLRSTLKVFAERIPTSVQPSQAFQRLYGSTENAFWLDSSIEDCRRARFSYMGDASGALAETVSYNVQSRTLTVKNACGESSTFCRSIFDYLESRLAARKVTAAPDVPCDFQGGFVGYFGYELKAELQGRAAATAPTPDAYWIFADRVIAFDRETRSFWLLCVDSASGLSECNVTWMAQIRATLREIETTTHSSTPGSPDDEHAGTLHDLRWHHDPSSYIQKIHQSLEQIRMGETYEVCLTNQLNGTIDIDPLYLYQHLRRINPAPYSAFLHFGQLSVLSSSPELFLSISDTGVVESKPIKGTAPRSADASEDAALSRELASSVKNRSENLMIVDLLRNDLNRVCTTGSVQVPSIFGIESYATVHQLVSTIRGQLKQDATVIDCIRATFPGGSMTGAPKVRTMSILDDIEQNARGIYSGSIGYLSLTGSARLNIVIRTLVINEKNISIGTGGAIVALSDPAEEFAEIILKVEMLLSALRAAGIRVDTSALNTTTDNLSPAHDELLRIREEIDEIDRKLIGLLGDRFTRCMRVGELKDTYTIPVWQPNRVAEVKENAARAALRCGVSPEFARHLWAIIINEASRMEIDRQHPPQPQIIPSQTFEDASTERASG